MKQTVLVTGATRGIGQSIARKYHENGWIVLGVGTSKKSLDYLDELFVCDFANVHQLEELCSKVKNENIDVLINNAGINKINNFNDIDPNDFLKIQQVNLYAPFRLCQTVLPYMEKSNWGRIVNISSVWGKKSKKGRASYSSSKFAIDGMTIALADEFSQKNILANCISPGFIDTDMTRNNLGPSGIAKILERIPTQRLAQADEIANFVYWLGSENNSYISGQNFAIDGGFTRV